MPPHPLESLWTLVLIVLLACACLFLVGLGVGLAHAKTVYVSPQGSDTHSCTQATTQSTPRKTVQQGIACLAGGDTLLLADGVYHEQVSDYADAEHPGTVRPPSGLSWSQPTTIKAANPRKATIDKPQAGYPYNHVVFLARPDTRYVVIEGLVIDGRGNGACVWVGPSSHMRFQGNVMKNCGRNGVFGSVADDGTGAEDIQLLDNEIFNISLQETGYPGAHAIYFTGSKSVARNNYIHAPCPFYGIHYTSEHGGLYSNVIENNRVAGCHQAGIFSQGRDTVIRNNLLENNCIGIYLSSAPTLVANNTVYGWHSAWNCSDSYGIFDKSGGSTLSNNLLLQQKTYIYAHATPPTMQTNLCDASGCQLTAQPGSVIVDGANGNLTLKAGGPAVNTGTTLAQVPTDRLGVPRPQGNAYDIGAYEYTTSAPPEPGAGADVTAPTVAVTTPVAGAMVSGKAVTIQAEASDNVGVVRVQFYADSQMIGQTQSSAPYQSVLDSTTVPNGPYALTAEAVDAAGNKTVSSPVPVTVTNGPIGPARPLPPGPEALSCTGDLGANGKIALVCTPQPAGRR